MAEVLKEIRFSKTFKKQYKKLPKKTQAKFDERFLLWQQAPDHPLLRRHRLTGPLKDFYSFDVTGDVRAIYEIIGSSVVVYQIIGSHSQLYG